MRKGYLLRKIAIAAAVLLVSACSSPAPGTAKGEINVFAAASLNKTFTQLGKDFEAAHGGTSVKFNFAGSSALAQQINNGAPADVFASAAPANMKQVEDKGHVSGKAVNFVTNTLRIAVPKGNPKNIHTLADVVKPDVKLALCAEQVPCGAAAKTVFGAAKLTPKPVTLEQDVSATRTKLELGEVDAALIYRTDVQADADKLDGIDFPEMQSAVNDYPIAVLSGAKNAELARAWVDYVRGEHGKELLAKAGFTVV
ncbi:molybdate ABC transporter substrate-binding protein [Pseudonocardiaceae bacterium YIM PH 21723]|nr:molybdate ABC transporter substrate-binding protein [Pseudonocardiaceae bacterium YIM PH 21723]